MPTTTWAIVLSSQGKYEAAEAHFAEAVRLHPGYADAHNNLGVVLYAQGKYEAAEAHFTEALRLNPGYADAHNNLGTILSRQQEVCGGTRLISLRPYGSNPATRMRTTPARCIMAACPEAKFRDGKRAVEFATRACELTQVEKSRLS